MLLWLGSMIPGQKSAGQDRKGVMRTQQTGIGRHSWRYTWSPELSS